MQFIEVEHLKEFLCDNVIFSDWHVYEQIMLAIDNIPKIDTDKQRRSKWVQGFSSKMARDKDAAMGYDYIECNECGGILLGVDLENESDRELAPDYCPDCGCRMEK